MAIFAFIFGSFWGAVAVFFSVLIFDIGLWGAIATFYLVTYAVAFFPALLPPVYPARRFGRQLSRRTNVKHTQTS